MNTGKWKERFAKIRSSVHFQSDSDQEEPDGEMPAEPEENADEGLEIQADEDADGGLDAESDEDADKEQDAESDEDAEEILDAQIRPVREPLSMEERIAIRRRFRLIARIAAVVLVLGIVLGLFLYNHFHTFTDYVVSKSIENTMTSGTEYEEVGKFLYRYNTDGVSCVTRKNDVKWSITYSMQAPIVDVCGKTMVIAEQQGTQIYVVNEDGLLGNFTTLLPILKVRVSEQGVVAAVLQDEDVTWVNLYDAGGESIASDRTTLSDSGYPLDVDLSPNGEKMIVSYLGITEGVMTTDIVFYDFGEQGEEEENFEINRESISGSAAPQVYFIDNSTAAVVTDDGFYVYSGSKMNHQTGCEFDEEIVSCFCSDDVIGFLFSDLSDESVYRMDIYNYNGKLKASTGVNAVYDSIKVEHNRILMFTSSSCCVYTTDGKLRYSASYEKEIVDMFYFDEFRRYLIVTGDSFDRIRIC